MDPTVTDSFGLRTPLVHRGILVNPCKLRQTGAKARVFLMDFTVLSIPWWIGSVVQIYTSWVQNDDNGQTVQNGGNDKVHEE